MKDGVEKAFDRIVGHCLKHTYCERCRFYVGDECVFRTDDPPVAWKKLRNGEVK